MASPYPSCENRSLVEWPPMAPTTNPTGITAVQRVLNTPELVERIGFFAVVKDDRDLLALAHTDKRMYLFLMHVFIATPVGRSLGELLRFLLGARLCRQMVRGPWSSFEIPRSVCLRAFLWCRQLTKVRIALRALDDLGAAEDAGEDTAPNVDLDAVWVMLREMRWRVPYWDLLLPNLKSLRLRIECRMSLNTLPFLFRGAHKLRILELTMDGYFDDKDLMWFLRASIRTTLQNIEELVLHTNADIFRFFARHVLPQMQALERCHVVGVELWYDDEMSLLCAGLPRTCQSLSLYPRDGHEWAFESMASRATSRWAHLRELVLGPCRVKTCIGFFQGMKTGGLRKITIFARDVEVLGHSREALIFDWQKLFSLVAWNRDLEEFNVILNLRAVTLQKGGGILTSAIFLPLADCPKIIVFRLLCNVRSKKNFMDWNGHDIKLLLTNWSGLKEFTISACSPFQVGLTVPWFPVAMIALFPKFCRNLRYLELPIKVGYLDTFFWPRVRRLVAGPRTTVRLVMSSMDATRLRGGTHWMDSAWSNAVTDFVDGGDDRYAWNVGQKIWRREVWMHIGKGKLYIPRRGSYAYWANRMADLREVLLHW